MNFGLWITRSVIVIEKARSHPIGTSSPLAVARLGRAVRRQLHGVAAHDGGAVNRPCAQDEI